MVDTAEPIIVYTCVTHLYDRRIQAARPAAGVRFVCFTDTPGKIEAPGWEVRRIESPARLSSGHDINRYHKLFPHRLFPEARWSVYLDGNLRFDGDWHELVARVAGSGSALGAFWHPRGHDLTTEVEVCHKSRFDRRDVEVIDRQVAYYASRGIDPAQKIPTNNLLVRDHAAPGFDRAMSIWWAQLFEFCKRDQVSLMFALKEAGATWQPLDGAGGLSPDLVRLEWHKPPLKARILRRIRQKLGIRQAG